MYFIFRLVVVALFVWYSIKYSLNYFNTLPIKNIPAYITVSASVTILGPSYLSFYDIYIRYPLSLILILLNYLTASSLTILVPILFSLLLKASWPWFIWFMTSLSCPIVTICKSYILDMLALLLELGPGVVLTAFSGIFINTCLPWPW